MLRLKNSSLHDDQTSQTVSWGHWFALFNIFIVVALGSRYLFIADWSQTLLGRFYALISTMGHFSFLTFIFYLILIFPLSFLIRSSKWQRIIAVIITTFLMTILLIDLEIFSRFRLHLTFSIWKVLISPDDQFVSTEWQKLFIFIPFILLIETVFAVWIWKKLRSLSKRKRYCYPVIFILMTCFVSSHLIHIWADANFYRPITMQRSSLPLSYPLTARHFLENYGLIKKGDYESRIEQEGDPFAIAIEYPLTKINDQRAQSPNNILLITMDEWDSQNQLKNMPKLAKFASQHIEFTDHYSASKEDYLSEFSLFYGVDPNYYDSMLTGHYTSVLIDTLTKQHYSLGLFSSDNFNHPLYHYALLSNFSMPMDHKPLSYIDTSQLWLSWYEAQNSLDNQPAWFSVIQFKHNQQTSLTEQQQQLDNAIDKVISRLAQSGELDRTVIIITANNTKKSVDSNRAYRDELRVPLIVTWPNKKPQVITKPTSHVDIVQTLMEDLLNVTTPAKFYGQGENLFAKSQRKWRISGEKNKLNVLYRDKTIVLDMAGDYQIYSLDNQRLKEELGLSTFLQIMTENRRFMVTK